MTEPAGPQQNTKTPSDFLKSIRGRQVVVKLNSGVDYRGTPACFNSTLAFAPAMQAPDAPVLPQTEEYVNGQLKTKYGDAFIRGNNGTPVLPRLAPYWPVKAQNKPRKPKARDVPAVLYISASDSLDDEETEAQE
eukprot:scaffold7594_cov417-Prasinococcus_capsulatus_cf.AAC.1